MCVSVCVCVCVFVCVRAHSCLLCLFSCECRHRQEQARHEREAMRLERLAELEQQKHQARHETMAFFRSQHRQSVLGQSVIPPTSVVVEGAPASALVPALTSPTAAAASSSTGVVAYYGDIALPPSPALTSKTASVLVSLDMTLRDLFRTVPSATCRWSADQFRDMVSLYAAHMSRVQQQFATACAQIPLPKYASGLKVLHEAEALLQAIVAVVVRDLDETYAHVNLHISVAQADVFSLQSRYILNRLDKARSFQQLVEATGVAITPFAKHAVAHPLPTATWFDWAHGRATDVDTMITALSNLFDAVAAPVPASTVSPFVSTATNGNISSSATSAARTETTLGTNSSAETLAALRIKISAAAAVAGGSSTTASTAGSAGAEAGGAAVPEKCPVQ
jgi:hypothetical protein